MEAGSRTASSLRSRSLRGHVPCHDVMKQAGGDSRHSSSAGCVTDKARSAAHPIGLARAERYNRSPDGALQRRERLAVRLDRAASARTTSAARRT